MVREGVLTFRKNKLAVLFCLASPALILSPLNVFHCLLCSGALKGQIKRAEIGRLRSAKQQSLLTALGYRETKELKCKREREEGAQCTLGEQGTAAHLSVITMAEL